jgi:hypothetical protein
MKGKKRKLYRTANQLKKPMLTISTYKTSVTNNVEASVSVTPLRRGTRLRKQPER